MGWEKRFQQYFFDVSFNVSYQPQNEWIVLPYALPISSLQKTNAQITVGRFFQWEDTFFSFGAFLGHTRCSVSIADSYAHNITLEEDEESPALRYDSIRTGIRLHSQSGKNQGIRVGGEWGINFAGHTDSSFSLGYFFTL